MTEELTWKSARELRRLIAARQISPVDVVTACLARIEALDPTLHAFITVVGDRALDDAKAAEAAVQRGDELGPLHGVPVALKDEAWTADIPSTGGSLLFKRFVPSHDGTVTARLRRAGAIVIGKTNLPEFAAWPRSKTRLVGEAVNPWDTTRISGASSGGSAAAVAAGMVPLAIGSDGGGSTRIPSAFCGVFGLFPTPGRVPSYGSFSYSPEGSLGPIGRHVADVALLQQVIAGPDPRDALALTQPAPDVLSALGQEERRCASRGLPISVGSPSTRASPPPVANALERAAAAGAVVEEITDRIEHPWGDGSLLADLQAAVAAGTWDLDYDDVDIPDTSREQQWMWATFGSPVPLTATPEFRALCTATGICSPRHRSSPTSRRRPPVDRRRPSTNGRGVEGGDERGLRDARRHLLADHGHRRSRRTSGLGHSVRRLLHGHQLHVHRQQHRMPGRFGSVWPGRRSARGSADHRPARRRSDGPARVPGDRGRVPRFHDRLRSPTLFFFFCHSVALADPHGELCTHGDEAQRRGDRLRRRGDARAIAGSARCRGRTRLRRRPQRGRAPRCARHWRSARTMRETVGPHSVPTRTHDPVPDDHEEHWRRAIQHAGFVRILDRHRRHQFVEPSILNRPTSTVVAPTAGATRRRCMRAPTVPGFRRRR